VIHSAYTSHKCPVHAISARNSLVSQQLLFSGTVHSRPSLTARPRPSRFPRTAPHTHLFRYPQKQRKLLPKTPPACASYRSYRGIGRPANYSAARACAWQERLAQKADLGQNREEPIAWVVGGSLILADIYFNGTGVKRNIPLAMRFACESEEGMARLALPNLTKFNGSPRAHRPFEFCDYAATTFTMNFCSGYASQAENDRRSRYYDSLKSFMTPEQGWRL
jgi:hypothetical protein